MPILFKQHQRFQSSQRFTPDRPQPRRLLNAPGTAIRRLSIRLSEGRQLRAGLRRHSIRAGRSARRSISRLRRHGSSLRKYFRDPKLLCQLAKYIYQKRHIKHLLPLLLVMLYMLIGALLFQWLEVAPEKERILEKNSAYENERTLFVKRMEEIMVDLVTRDPQKRREHVEEAVDHLSWKLSYELASKQEEWSFSTSMYFAGTIFTTIGYGDVACSTGIGRLATVLYAIFGIPLMLITWTEMGKFLYKTINEFVDSLNKKCKFGAGLAKLKSKLVTKCCPTWRRKVPPPTEEDKDVSTSEATTSDLMDALEKGEALKQNGNLPNQRRRRLHHQKRRTKAVNFKFSMQMPPASAGDGIPTSELLEQIDKLEKEEEEKKKKRRNRKGSEEEDDDDDEASKKDETGRETDSLESETVYDNLMAKEEPGKGAGDQEDGNHSEKDEESSSDEDEESSEEESEDEEEEDIKVFRDRYEFDGMMGEDEPKEEEAPRMHVLVAIGSTFAWIFLCAALFQFWEDWSYWESLYFMFISLFTVGLGDINVRRRDLMVLCFIFVIIGLSLVSMCIMVIQSSLEDLYRRLLVKVLTDYQTKLGKDKSMGAGVPWKALGGSRTAAKYLLPILSENQKRSVMQKVQEEARESGMEIPANFNDYNGLNEVIEEQEDDPLDEDEAKKEEVEISLPPPPIANGILKHAPVPSSEVPAGIPIAKSASFSGLLSNLRENCTQTDLLRRSDSSEQTMRIKMRNLAAQTEQTLVEALRRKTTAGRPVHVGQQMDGPDRVNKKIQSAIQRFKDAGTATETSGINSQQRDKKSAATQTVRMRLHCEDVHVQTEIPFDLVGLFDKEVQTFKFMKNRRIQTPVPMLHDEQTQTVDVDLRGSLYPSVSMLRLFLSPIEAMHDAMHLQN